VKRLAAQAASRFFVAKLFAKAPETVFRLVLLVGRRAVDRRHRNIVQPQVNAKLPAVMNDVIYDEAPKGGCARKRENGFTAGLQRENLFQILIA
jgi:hypothetical protein